MGDASWPTSGVMANRVSQKLVEDGLSDNGAQWGPFMLAAGETHNSAFTHAITPYAVSQGFHFVEGSFIPSIGPLYDEAQTNESVDHFVPWFKILLNDSINLFEELSGDSRSADAGALLEAADRWWQSHPMPMAVLPAYQTVDQDPGPSTDHST